MIILCTALSISSVVTPGATILPAISSTWRESRQASKQVVEHSTWAGRKSAAQSKAGLLHSTNPRGHLLLPDRRLNEMQCSPVPPGGRPPAFSQCQRHHGSAGWGPSLASCRCPRRVAGECAAAPPAWGTPCPGAAAAGAQARPCRRQRWRRQRQQMCGGQRKQFRPHF